MSVVTIMPRKDEKPAESEGRDRFDARLEALSGTGDRTAPPRISPFARFRNPASRQEA